MFICGYLFMSEGARVEDVDVLRANWDKTQLGQLMNDPSMKLFVDDFHAQRSQLLKR